MQAFTTLTAAAAPIDLPNIDTDRIIPARFLRKGQDAPGYDDYFFHDVRFNADGSEKPEFVLNQPAYRAAKILVTAENFGCGSSREAAVWAHMAYGVRSVIGPSFGDIFYNNCSKNGLLAVQLPAAMCAAIRAQLHARPGATMTVDLTTQQVIDPDGTVHAFEIDGFKKQGLLTGQDEIGLTFSYEELIGEFERRQRQVMPWLVVDRSPR
jgi:3-isopropylmalate/(R)-2-methylmalate dehydratase small subunit